MKHHHLCSTQLAHEDDEARCDCGLISVPPAVLRIENIALECRSLLYDGRFCDSCRQEIADLLSEI